MKLILTSYLLLLGAYFGLAIPTKNLELATDLTCYQCILDEPCFTDHTDGESAACTEPEYNGCYKAKVEYDGKIGIIRFCHTIPEGIESGTCLAGEIGGLNGTVCYCRGNDCNRGDVETVTTPSPPAPPEQNHCYRCKPDWDCFANGDGNGDPVICEEFEQGCYKEQLEKDGVTGIQRDCAIFPEGVSDGDCVKSLISGETCYCKGENCNAGDMDTTTTTPSPPAPPEQHHCYHCHPNEDCFADGDGNGDPVLCEEFEQGCYKEQMEKDGVIGIKRDCAMFPEGISDGMCVQEDHASKKTCYCKGENCNGGDLDATTKPPKTTPSDKQKCYRCLAGENCFENSNHGKSVECDAPTNTGCYKALVEYDSVTGIQRDCAEFPEGVKDGECSIGDIAGVNGTVCYCHGENCNNGDVLTSSTETTITTPPSPSEKQKCLRCIAGENCFTDDSEDGESVECQAPTNTGCYKALVEYDGEFGIQRDCAEVPDGPIDEDKCKMNEIGGLNGTVCYCHGENCNSGDVLTSSTKTTKTTPPSPSDKQKCLRCLSGENCFSDNSEDGESVECVAPTNTGCYKISTEYDGQSGIQRDCAEVPEGPIDECTLGDIGGMHGTLCYCHGENCNSGDVHTKTTPSPHKFRCLLCGVDEDCFNNPDVDGESTECSDEENMGCYKASVERDDHVKGIQRGCTIIPDDISEGDCKDGDVFGRNGTICYCKENDCNKGDVTPPTPELTCLNCFIEEDCFSNPDVDGVSSKCEAPENTGCYKALIERRDDGVKGIQRGCTKYPENVTEGNCVLGEMNGMNGTICYCKEKDCNKGGVTPSPTPPPSEKKRCLLCLADEDCFNNPDVDGESTLCDQQTGDTGCYKALVERGDHVKGIQRGCAKIPDGTPEGDCVNGEIGGLNGTICYCKGNDCNKGDIDNPPTPPPSDKLRCLKCMAGDPCYDNPDVDGESEECSDTDNCKDDCDGCYKALLETFDQGIQRGCAKIPKNVTDGDCIDGKIGETNANICYCKGNDCNKGDVKPSPTPPPSDKLRCLRCMAGDPCFDDPDVDGESAECEKECDDCNGCYKALLKSDDQGIQRGCTKIPQNVTDGDCIDGKIGEVNANICYCKGNDCNKGDVKPSPTPPPSDKLRCLKCEAQDACFNNPDVDGESTTCEAPENTGCYKALVERDDHVKGIQRGCAKYPDNTPEGDCVTGEIGGMNGTICYCKGNDCNKGDIDNPKTTPKPPGKKLKCYKCLSDANCFYDGQADGTLIECEAPENTGCYKASIENRGIHGIMRGCTEYPKELNHGSDCIYGSAMPGSPIGRICYCDTGDGCNTGDVETTVPPTITTPKNNGAAKFCINMFQILGFLLITRFY